MSNQEHYSVIYGKQKKDEQGEPYKEVRCLFCYTLLGREWQNGRHQGLKHGNGYFVRKSEVFQLREISRLKHPPLKEGDLVFMCDACKMLAGELAREAKDV